MKNVDAKIDTNMWVAGFNQLINEPEKAKKIISKLMTDAYANCC